MKLIFSLLLLMLAGILSVPPTSAGKQNSLGNSINRFSTNAKLQLTTKVMKEVSCDSNSLSLDLRFIFTNVGTVPIILDKRSSVVGRDYVSLDLQSAAKRKYVESFNHEDSGPYIPTGLAVPDDMSNFVILQPGRTYEVDSPWTRVSFAVNDGTPHLESGLNYRSYILQVGVGTWVYYLEGVAEKARKKWRDKGYLWTEPLLSSPMPFTVDKNRPITNCR